jgi:hypothetical protein
MHITTVIEITETTIAEEVEPGCWALRQKSVLDGEIKTIYLTTSDIQHLSRKVNRNGK